MNPTTPRWPSPILVLALPAATLWPFVPTHPHLWGLGVSWTLIWLTCTLLHVLAAFERDKPR